MFGGYRPLVCTSGWGYTMEEHWVEWILSQS